MIYCHTPTPSPGASPEAGAQAQRAFRPGRLFTHLSADTTEELKTYVKSIGMNPRWIQYEGTNREHFDVTGKFLERILADDRVVKMTSSEWARKRFPKGEVF